MNIRIKPTVLVACGLAALPIAALRTPSRADTYPTQGTQNFHAKGVITLVDADRDRVTITTSDGHTYNLDTDNTQIKLIDTTRPGDTGDLVAGMHIDVTGRLLSSNIVAVDKMSVLPIEGGDTGAPPPSDEPVDNTPAPPVAPAPVRPPADNGPLPDLDAPQAPAGTHIRLRGTVQSVDDEDGVVVVRVGNHQRNILVGHDTDLTDIHSSDDDHIGLHDGDRVTVVGTLHSDGAVSATAISLARNIRAAQKVADARPPVENDGQREYVGRVLHPADFTTRDIKIGLDEGRIVSIHVPHEARILRDGRPISVHDLTDTDVIRVVGSYDGGEFDAARIEVLQTYQNNM